MYSRTHKHRGSVTYSVACLSRLAAAVCESLTGMEFATLVIASVCQERALPDVLDLNACSSSTGLWAAYRIRARAGARLNVLCRL